MSAFGRRMVARKQAAASGSGRMPFCCVVWESSVENSNSVFLAACCAAVLLVAALLCGAREMHVDAFMSLRPSIWRPIEIRFCGSSVSARQRGGERTRQSARQRRIGDRDLTSAKYIWHFYTWPLLSLRWPKHCSSRARSSWSSWRSDTALHHT